jgi:hypothetical protein
MRKKLACALATSLAYHAQALSVHTLPKTQTLITSARTTHSHNINVRLFAATTPDAPPGYTCVEDECFLEEQGVLVNDVNVKPSTIRNLQLQDANGDTTRLAAKLGEDTSVVVFLRHLG